MGSTGVEEYPEPDMAVSLSGAVDPTQAAGVAPMIVLGLVLTGTPIVLFTYAYLVYPVLLRLLGKARPVISSHACPSVDQLLDIRTTDQQKTAKNKQFNRVQFDQKQDLLDQ